MHVPRFAIFSLGSMLIGRQEAVRGDIENRKRDLRLFELAVDQPTVASCTRHYGRGRRRVRCAQRGLRPVRLTVQRGPGSGE